MSNRIYTVLIVPERSSKVRRLRIPHRRLMQASLVAQPLRDRFFTRGIPFPGSPGMPHLPDFVFMRGEGVFGSAELVPMTPKLGQYFGTETGLLVVRAPDDSRLKLEDGDVIVDIDGRTPANVAHALRILSSYQAGEKLKLNILRMKKRMSFEVTVPEDTSEKRLHGPRREQGLMRGRTRCHRLEGEFHLTDDDHERVVVVMSDATGKAPYRLHLLGFDEPMFECASVPATRLIFR